jgi:epsilon-lactone hydrolase
VHGGVYLFDGRELSASAALQHARIGRITVFSVDYRMPPDHPFPAALDDTVAAYKSVLKRYKRGMVGITGFSAGGGLAAAALLKARDSNLPLPAAAVLLSPEADLSESGDSFQTCVYPRTLLPVSKLYADGASLTEPYLSPLFGDFKPGFLPTMIQSGTRDFFLSNSALLHRKLKASSIEAELHVREAMPHSGFGGLAPEDREVLDEQFAFFGKRLA